MLNKILGKQSLILSGIQEFSVPEDIRQEEAILLLRDILNTQRAELGMNDPISEESAYRLAKLLEESGRFSESEQLYRDVLAIKRSTSNNEVSDVADSIECLASVLEKMNRQNEAEPLYRRIVGTATQHRIREK